MKELCCSYGYLRIKWNIARGFRYTVKSFKDDTWELERKAGGTEWEIQSYTLRKVIKDGKTMAECDCGESEHTGFPCAHICLLNYKGLVSEMTIDERWWKSHHMTVSRITSATGKQSTTESHMEKSSKMQSSAMESKGKNELIDSADEQEEDTSMDEAESAK